MSVRDCRSTKVFQVALAALAAAAIACGSDEPEGSSSSGDTGGSSSSGEASSTTGPGGSCSQVGGPCSESYDCCNGTACTNGQCECSKSVPYSEGCSGDGDCCVDSPDHQGCQPDGYCGFTGELVLESMGCEKVGNSGININEYCVTLAGTLTGPVGASWDWYTDPQNTVGGGCPAVSGCSDWDDGTGYCARVDGQPATTQFSFSYRFGSDMTSLDVAPTANLNGPNGALDQELPTVHCQAP